LILNSNIYRNRGFGSDSERVEKVVPKLRRAAKAFFKTAKLLKSAFSNFLWNAGESACRSNFVSRYFNFLLFWIGEVKIFSLIYHLSLTIHRSRNRILQKDYFARCVLGLR